MYIVTNKDFTEKEEDLLLLDFNKALGKDLLVSLKKVNNVQVSPSGKRRSVISHIASQYKVSFNQLLH